jgi:branched-chain amino acid aminotransferase
MAQLQKPPYVYMNGRITPWDEAHLHVAAESVIHCTNVFEGMKGYWREDGKVFSIRNLRDHYERLCRSAVLLSMPFDMSLEHFARACFALLEKLVVPGRDSWFRPTLFATQGNWGEDNVTDLVITAYTQPQKRSEPIDIGVSTWQRPGDACQAARIKAGANYQVGRLARIQGRAHGYADVVLMNQWGRVAEATASCIVAVRGGEVITPPASEGALESVTVNIVERICAELGTRFVRRPLDRTELYIADEVYLVGTVGELTPVRRVESVTLPAKSPIMSAVTDAFWDCMRGKRAIPGVTMTPVPGIGESRVAAA